MTPSLLFLLFNIYGGVGGGRAPDMSENVPFKNMGMINLHVKTLFGL